MYIQALIDQSVDSKTWGNQSLMVWLMKVQMDWDPRNQTDVFIHLASSNMDLIL